MERTLYRARKGRWLFGVCAGMAEYMSLSPLIVRLIFAAMSLFFGGGILMYIVGIFIIPMEPKKTEEPAETNSDGE